MTAKVNYETREGRTHNAYFDDVNDAIEFRDARKRNHPELYCSRITEEE